MSTGTVVCSKCCRVVYQDGWKLPDGRVVTKWESFAKYNWMHMATREPICEGADAVYPKEQP